MQWRLGRDTAHSTLIGVALWGRGAEASFGGLSREREVRELPSSERKLLGDVLLQ